MYLFTGVSSAAGQQELGFRAARRRVVRAAVGAACGVRLVVRAACGVKLAVRAACVR